MTSDLTALAAGEIAQGVRDGVLDPVAVVDAHLARIEALDARLRAFVSVMGERAHAEARALGKTRYRSALALAGVPVAVKDNVAVAGEVSRYGSRAVHSSASARDDLIVTRLRSAGAVVIGRTRMSELAIWPFVEPDGDAPSRNPYDPERTPGGSSGGSAIAVAARMAALAIASDGGGSIRIPAACCGIVGVKPAPGVVPLPGGAASHWFGLSAFGPLARSVEDAALMLDVVAATESYRRVREPEGTLRVAVSTRHPVVGAPVSRVAREAVTAAARALRLAGHDVSRADPPYPIVPDEFLVRYLAGIAEDAETYDVDERLLERRTRTMARRGRMFRGRTTDASRSRYAARMRRWLGDFDAVLTPVLAQPPVPIGRWRGRGWLSTVLGVSRWMGHAPPWNLACLAAIAVPVGMSDGLPVAVQIAGPPGSEATLLGLALQLERALPPLRPPGGASLVEAVQAGR